MSSEKLVFRSKRPEDKLSRTDSAAREIIEAEHAAQLAKTERLRAARLKRDAAAPEPKPVAPARKTRPAASRPKRFQS